MRPFRRLQWQLSLSYTLVAAGAMLFIELMLILGVIVLINSDTLSHIVVRAFREQFSTGLRPYLDRPEPDLAGLNRYMAVYWEEAAEKAQNDQRTQLWTAADASQHVLVLAPDRRLLWTQFPFPGNAVGQVFPLANIPGLAQVLPKALSNARDPTELMTRAGDWLVMAVPVLSEDQQRVVGVMVFQLSMPSFTNPDFISQLMPGILVSVVVFTLIAGLFGSVFGYFTARRLTRRLGSISVTSDLWSRGDFSSDIADLHDDELGDLASRLNGMAGQLRNLMDTRQELAALEERNRIARELHDSVKQQVFATSMQLGAARALLPDDNSPAAARLDEAERLAHQAQSELNALIHELRPAALEGKGLARALREYAADWSRQTGVETSYEGPPPGSEIALPVLKEQALYRVAQEALANIARHSHAHHARVALTRENGKVYLAIQDDGSGFDPEAVKGKGIGLNSMRERIEGLGGQVEIHSRAGEGTRIAVRLPG